MTAREAAVTAVMSVTDKKKSIHRVVAETLNEMGDCDVRERAFMKRLTEGTVEHLYSIDYVINSFSKTKTEKMKPYIRAVIRIGAYQLLFTDIPASAACNEAVNYAKKHGLAGLSGFVNGVLRNISREGKKVLEEGMKLPGSKGIEIKYSVPAWLFDQWKRDYGIEIADKIAAAQFEAEPIYFRVNTSKGTVVSCLEKLKAEGIECKVPELKLPETLLNYRNPDGSPLEMPVLEAVNSEGFAATKAFKQGLFTVQDISSVTVGAVSGIKGGEMVLDMCAAPGGKTLHVADLLKAKNKGGSIAAADLTASKVELIKENLERCGFDNVGTAVMDASVFRPEFAENFDLVLADVPCSGTGVTGRKPDIKYNMTPEIQEELITLQKSILENAAGYVKKGGTLVFSTCTLNRSENEAGMKLLLEKGLKKELEIQLIPGVHSADGFFVSKFIKE